MFLNFWKICKKKFCFQSSRLQLFAFFSQHQRQQQQLRQQQQQQHGLKPEQDWFQQLGGIIVFFFLFFRCWLSYYSWGFFEKNDPSFDWSICLSSQFNVWSITNKHPRFNSSLFGKISYWGFFKSKVKTVANWRFEPT